mmetsp:Transcript_27306/g.41305  ORF Transcript_27306/g.41305 Transcript_27306/m.41305 type:complete len:83 (-) Transcript_27306:997-1245(-)
MDLMMQMLRDLGISDEEDDMKKVKNAWVLLDNTQNWYGESYWPFWQFLIKIMPLISVLSLLRLHMISLHVYRQYTSQPFHTI